MVELETPIEAQGQYREVNFNNYCYVQLTEAGEEWFRKVWGENNKDIDGFVAAHRMPDGSHASQIHQLMWDFGPMFQDGMEDPPFTHVTLRLDGGVMRNIERERQTIDVNDFVRVILRSHARARLESLFHSKPPFRQIGPYTEMQFHAVMHLFGGDHSPFVNGSIYISTPDYTEG